MLIFSARRTLKAGFLLLASYVYFILCLIFSTYILGLPWRYLQHFIEDNTGKVVLEFIGIVVNVLYNFINWVYVMQIFKASLKFRVLIKIKTYYMPAQMDVDLNRM